MQRACIAAAFLILAGCNAVRRENQTIRYPATKAVDSADIFYGIRIPDPYRWLENYSSPDGLAWIARENKVTEDYLSQIPFRKKIKDELTALVSYGRMTAPRKHGDYYYFRKNSGLENQNPIYRVTDPADTASARLFLDPNTFSENGSVSLQETYFTHDGTLMAYEISSGGSDWREALIKDTKTGRLIGDTIRNLKFSSVSWLGDDGFYYVTYDLPAGADRLVYKTAEASVYYHKLGTAQSADVFVFGGNKEPYQYLDAYVTEDSRYLVVLGSNSSNSDAVYIRDLTQKDTQFTKLIGDLKGMHYIVDNRGATLYIYTNLDAPDFRLVKVDASSPTYDHWKDVIPETDQVLQVNTAGGYFIATYLSDVKDKIDQYDYQGKRIREIALPAAGTADGLSSQHDQPDLYYSFTSFAYPSSVYHYNLKDGTNTLYWEPKVNFRPSDYQTTQVFYPSKDGTKIPMYIVYKKGIQLNGKNPTWLYAYGGFDVSLLPNFSMTRMEWLEHGGVYAQPNLRGGGEYGEKWHLAGTRMHKQRVFDDYAAAAKYLIDKKYTSSPYLATVGGSNGGLLVGATMAEHPGLMGVAIPMAGVMDMLRYNRFTAGAGWASEYGTAEDSLAMFKYLLGYSPLQNIKKGVRYPATFVWAADHDDRVEPGASFKFAATLQADNAGSAPMLIKIGHNVGHWTGMDLGKQLSLLADQYAFTWYNMHVNPFR
jgi:prolyl oligopeptidase